MIISTRGLVFLIIFIRLSNISLSREKLSIVWKIKMSNYIKDNKDDGISSMDLLKFSYKDSVTAIISSHWSLVTLHSAGLDWLSPLKYLSLFL